jgi:alpha-ketoglutarate-dependent taurine dioxygenase
MANPISPFALDNRDAYLRWRDVKLREHPTHADELLVEVSDPRNLTPSERQAIAARLQRANMAIYVSPLRDADKELPRSIARQFGLRNLDGNWLADEDGISSLTVSEGGDRVDFIPYTNKAIRWHTDGYYNPPQRRIHAMVLHCVQDAASGGDNALLDHEIAYILLRDQDPAHIAALMAPDAMTIPARSDAEGVSRPAETGPVFHVDPHSGRLHMRYTARTRSIEWRQDAATLAAVAALERILASPSPFIFRTRLTPGAGLICSNVLHDRSAFVDAPGRPRLLYRARYHDALDWAGGE